MDVNDVNGGGRCLLSSLEKVRCRYFAFCRGSMWEEGEDVQGAVELGMSGGGVMVGWDLFHSSRGTT